MRKGQGYQQPVCYHPPDLDSGIYGSLPAVLAHKEFTRLIVRSDRRFQKPPRLRVQPSCVILGRLERVCSKPMSWIIQMHDSTLLMPTSKAVLVNWDLMVEHVPCEASAQAVATSSVAITTKREECRIVCPAATGGLCVEVASHYMQQRKIETP